MLFRSDSVKPDSAAAIAALRAMGIRTVMLTGDREECARAVADEVGIGEVIAGVLPDRKAEAVRSLLGGDKVAMIGDGINDAPALTVADVGVAIGAGTDVAIEAADVVLMRSGLSDAVAAVRIGRATLRNIRENLFWAFFYNVVGIPLAAGAFAPLGLAISPMFGAAAMSLSSVTVVGNALRLNLLKPELRPAGGRRPEENESLNIKENNENESEESSMNETKIIRVEGMMCPHCEARVKAALEAIDGVSAAAPDHKSASVALTLARPVAEEELRAAVEGAGYKFG